MTKHIGRWLEIHESEIGLFLWTCLLLFLVRSSGILLNNYAETAFLKRFGVEYLPIVNMVNALATFVIMVIMTGLMARVAGARLFTLLFIFCGFSVAAIRLIIPLGIDLIYPLLFMLKSQYEVLLALLFWNLANDMFNTRQSKRLFPLITAGGVIGQILSSFATPWLARWLMLDNLLFVYLGTTLAGAIVVSTMGRRFPTLFHKGAAGGKRGQQRAMFNQLKSVIPLIKHKIAVLSSPSNDSNTRPQPLQLAGSDCSDPCKRPIIGASRGGF
jgi:ATP/ADP translocase